MTVSSLPTSCVLVLNYNGLEHLEACLCSARAAAEAVPACRAVLVDNRSTDASVAFTRERFPDVEIVIAAKNDYLFSLNHVIRARGEEIVVVVNNDMRFDPHFVAALLPHFSDPRVFAVAGAIRTWDGAADTVGPRCGRLHHSWFYKWWALDRQETANTLEACGGAAAYRRAAFVDLGGFDPIFRPGYYEDLDLSCRAWMHGWTVRYEPRGVAYHKVSASMVSRFGQEGKLTMMFRNHLLFTIKNIGGPRFLAGFLAMLPIRAVRPLLRGDVVPLVGFVRALPRFARALAARRRRGPRPLDINRFAVVTPVAPVEAP